jgi:gamma-glutamyltranspeptidase/glutathione hydrolase
MVSTRPELVGTFGMVASTHWLASSAGMAVLERGGNAFDAAVAAGFVLQVVEPHMNGPGGDMPAIVYSAEADRAMVVCGQGPAPQAATVERFRQIGLEMVPGTGLLPACVPGAFGGWMLMLRDLGTWRLRDVMEFAIRYAEDGFPLVPAVTSRIADVESIFRDEWPDSARVYLPDGRVPRPGGIFRNRRLAATLARLVREGEAAGPGREAQIDAATRAWYEGFVAEAIDDYFTSAEVLDDTGMRHAGLLRGADLAAWAAGFEAPASLDYGDWRVLKTGQWGQGPVFLQQLQLLAGFDLTHLDPSGADFIHLVVECAKLAFADRDAWYGCPGDADDVVGDLLDPAYAARRRALIGETASHELRPGAIRGRPGELPPLGDATGRSAGGGEPTAAPVHAGDTCHVDVVDRWGNLVSATPSGGWLQSSPVIPDLGFCMGTRAQMFTLAEGHPNTLAPGKRPRTTLSPSLAIRDERSRIAFGTPGGDQQDQWSLTFFVRLVAGDRDMQQVIDLPMFHTTSIYNSFAPHGWTPGRLVVEERVGSEVALELSRRGHDVEIVPGWSLGRLSAVEHDLEPGLLRAAANPRGMQGYAVGR